MRKFLVTAVTASIVFGGTYGFAASLGTGTGALGAGSNIVVACGTGLKFAYTTAFDPSLPGYAVSGIDLSNIPAGCLDRTVSVTFLGSHSDAAAPAVSASLPASGTTERIAIPLSASSIDADEVSGVSVVVS